MCGIFGVASGTRGDPYSKRRSAWIEGMVMSQFRGWDSAGVAVVQEVQEKGQAVNLLRVHKRALHFIDFVETKGTQRLLANFSDYHYVIGHTRASTKGNTEDKNAHPFIYDHIALVHNGTVNQHILDAKADETVDSAGIAASMAKVGELETLEKLDGGFALAWYNHKDDSLNLARNDSKPLGLGFLKGQNVLFFGSEWMAVHYAMCRNGLRPEMPMLALRPLTWYKFFKEELRDWEQKEFKEYTRPLYKGGVWADRRPPIIHPAQAPAGKQDEPTTKSITDKVTLPTMTGPTPSAERLKHVNNVLSKYGLKWGGLVMLRPTEWAAYAGSNNDVGRCKLEYLSDNSKKIQFWLHQCSRRRWIQYSDIDRVVCRIANTHGMEITKDFHIQVEEEPHWQGLVEKAYKNPLDNRNEIQDEPSRYDEGLAAWYDSKGKRVDLLGRSGGVPEKSPEPQKEAEASTLVKGPGGSQISINEWFRRTSTGCCYCSDPLRAEFANQIIWVKDEPLCPTCQNDPGAQEACGLVASSQKGMLN